MLTSLNVNNNITAFIPKPKLLGSLPKDRSKKWLHNKSLDARGCIYMMKGSLTRQCPSVPASITHTL